MRILVALAVGVAIPGVIYGVAIARSKSRLRQAYAALERDGRPMRAADVLPPAAPAEENAAVLYARAASLLQEQRLGTKDLRHYLGLSSSFVRGSITAEQTAELRRWMGQEVVATALTLAEKGTRCTVCRFDRRYDQGLPADLPIVEDLGKLMIILGAKAGLEAEAGGAGKAWNTVATQAVLADALRYDPIVLSKWSRAGLINYTCHTIQNLCETSPPVASDWQRTDDLLKDLDDIKPLVHAIDGERLLVGERLFSMPEDQLYRVLREGPGTGGDPLAEAAKRWEFRLATLGPRLIADHAGYLELMRRSAQSLERLRLNEESAVRTEIPGPRKQGLVTMRLGQRVWGTELLYRSMSASVRVTRAGLAAIRCRQAQGAFPQTPAALDLKGLVDPYTQGPLHYRRQDGGFVVYSVGEDLKDNGGSPRPDRRADPNGKHVEYDLVWRFPGRTAQGASHAN